MRGAFFLKKNLCVLCSPYATVLVLLNLVHVPVINGSACCSSNLTEPSMLERNSSWSVLFPFSNLQPVPKESQWSMVEPLILSKWQPPLFPCVVDASLLKFWCVSSIKKSPRFCFFGQFPPVPPCPSPHYSVLLLPKINIPNLQESSLKKWQPVCKGIFSNTASSSLSPLCNRPP